MADWSNSRVEEFNEAGEYITQFGTKGSGQGQLSISPPIGLATSSKGDVWVADANNNRVQKWNRASWRSEVSTEITVDGTQLASSQAAQCPTETCAITPEWTLEASAFSVGKHTVQIKATDGLGRTSTKSLTVEVQPDTTKPELTANSKFFTAPAGWLEQKPYIDIATAKDPSGSGVTSMALKIDGKTIQSSNQSCAEGECQLGIAGSVNVGTYSGGAHPAELIATDGAGNTATKRWTINVDPDGHITVSEAEDTLEALDATSESTIVAPTAEVVSSEERADGNDPSLIEGENGLESTGTPDPSSISVNPEGGFTTELPEGSISAEPVNVGEGATPMVVAEEAVAVGGNSTPNVDSVIRPIFDGLLTFGSIRDASAPETFSWKVNLGEGQVLRSVDPLDAEVDYEDGHEAYLIAAQKASDAIGSNVPTSLSVSEQDIVTLTVEHKEHSYVYPIVAGTGWEGGFRTEVVEGPKDAQELKEERERIEQEEHEAMERAAEQEATPGDEPPGEGVEVKDSPNKPRRVLVDVGAPEMYDWVQRKRRSKANAGYCESILGVLHCDAWHTWEVGTWFWNGTYRQVGGYAWQGDTVAKCYSHAGVIFTDDLTTMGWSGPNPAPYGYGKYLNLWCNFHVSWFNINNREEEYFQLQDHLYGDGYQGQHLKEMDPPYLQ